jgi:hypothetical protein
MQAGDRAITLQSLRPPLLAPLPAKQPGLGCSENMTEAPELLHARINFMGMGVAPRHEARFAASRPLAV